MLQISFIFISSFILLCSNTSGLLYPKEGLTREIKSLNGIWKFTPLEENKTSESTTDLSLMPVPSSYNEIGTSLAGRDRFKPVAYERVFYIPPTWLNNGRIWIRFGSVCYSATAYINNKLATTHKIGHLPFEADITSFVTNKRNTIKVIVDNTLSSSTIPQGSQETLPGGRIRQKYDYDFFNYGGIDRPVLLYHTPSVHIKDIVIKTHINNSTGIVTYEVTIDDDKEKHLTFEVAVVDENEKTIATGNTLKGILKISQAKLWWPYLMSDNPGYQYTLRVNIYNNKTLIDSYDELFGVRAVTWDADTLKINGKPIYLRGFGRHEDSDIRGKGLDLPLIIRDHNLMRWIGANAYRTSHYPYAEEIMDLADRLGIMILDESPAVHTQKYNKELLENHKRSLTELYQRDKNRPSVIMWSIANEPESQVAESKNYYKQVAAHMKELDNTRPITLADYRHSYEDLVGEFLDIICFNAYEGWYTHAGQLDTIELGIVKVAEGWRKKYKKPVLISEYGADTEEGLHFLPSDMWSEEYQTSLLSEYFKAFDKLRREGWFIGEMIWNFADFKTASGVKRVGFNKKGIFTRQRQPKNSAHFIRKRYWSLGHELNNATIPSDLEEYVINGNNLLHDDL